MNMVVRLIALAFVMVSLASCSTQHIAVTRQPNSEMSSLNNKNATVSPIESSSTAGKKSHASSSKALIEKYATIMQVENKTLDNLSLLEFIDDWYGVPYKYAGKDKNGIDCSSFVCALYKNVYKHDLNGTSAGLYKSSRHIKRNDLQQGDLVFFKIYKSRISHVGVFITNDYFVHASTKAGVVLSNLNEPYYKKYYGGAGRIKDEK